MKLFLKYDFFNKFFAVMRLSFVFIFLILVQASATSYSQTINLDVNNMEIRQVIKNIEQQSDYRFFYTDGLTDLSRKVNLNLSNQPIDQVLVALFDNTQLGFQLVDNKLIMLAPKGVLQLITITGVVTDAEGEPLPGVTIQIKGTTQGTATDANGTYTLSFPDENVILTFSYIGFITQEISVGNKRTIHVTMHEDAHEIDEIVVVGYGTQKKVNLSGAVDVVGSEVFTGRSLSNTTQALQGAVSNLNINLSDGKPNRTASFNVRGATSIGQGGNAYVLIDGVEGDPSMLNPNDIESVSVLKDAASAAIYGARGAFGVVLITTKKPQKGKTTINYTGNYSVQAFAKRPEYVTDAVTYLEHFREAWWNYNGALPTSLNNHQNYSDDWLNRMRDWKASGQGPKTEILPNGDYEYYCNTDWYGLLFKDQTFVHDHNLTISGGSDKSDFYVSGRFYNFDGMYNYDPDTYRSYNFRAKGSLMAFKWLQVTNNMEYSNTSYHVPYPTSGTTINALRYMQVGSFPCAPIYNPDGSYSRPAAYSLGGIIEKTNYHNEMRNLFKNTVGFNTNFFDRTLRVIGDYTFRYNDSDVFRKRVKVPYFQNANVSVPLYMGDINGTIRETTGHTMYTASNLYAEYENTFFNKHDLKAMAGWNYETYTYKANSIERNQLLLESAESVQLATGSSITPGASFTRWRTAGLFFRLNYGFQNRYLVEVNGRYDGSSRFPTDQQWGFFPSISGAWRLSEEPFWHVNKNIFSDVKFRVSYGSLGNGNISPYTYLELLSVGTSTRVLNGALNKQTSAPSPVPDGLTWEKATTTDYGLDFGMLKGRLRFSGDYYVRRTTDMYVTGPELPALFGASAPRGNYAEMTTRGFELTLNWQDKHTLAGKPFSYQIRGTFYDYVSVIDKFNNPTKRIGTYYDGMTIGEIWGFVTDGLFQSDPSTDEYKNTLMTPSADAKWRAGDLKVRNIDGSADNMITRGEGTVNNPGDQAIIGNSEPRYQYSANLNADWNGFFFSVFFQGVGKRDWWPGAESSFWGQYNRAYNWIPKWHLDNFWTENNRDAYLPRYAGSQSATGYMMNNVNDRYLQKVSYLMLKNIQLGYTLPDVWTSRISMKNVRIYFSGENLASWSPLYKVAPNFMDVHTAMSNTDIDIDSSYNNGSGNTYPLLKTFSLGISLTF